MCEYHLAALPRSPKLSEVLSPWSVFSALGLQVPYKSPTLYSFFPSLGWAQRESQVPRRGEDGAGRKKISLEAGENLLWEAPQAAKLLSAARGSGGTEAQAAGEGSGGAEQSAEALEGR